MRETGSAGRGEPLPSRTGREPIRTRVGTQPTSEGGVPPAAQTTALMGSLLLRADSEEPLPRPPVKERRHQQWALSMAAPQAVTDAREAHLAMAPTVMRRRPAHPARRPSVTLAPVDGH